jgi:DNA-binding transcriptional LysR family regulator
MDVRRLRYFCRVVESGSMSRAATSLNVAQPALSKSIQTLEQELETELFQRTSKGTVPTEAGERLYEHAQIIFTQIDRAKVEIRESTARPTGHVVVGMPHSIISRLGMPLLKEVTRRFPSIRIELAQEHSHVLAARLRSGRIDIAVSAAQRPSSELTSTPLLIEELFLVTPRDGKGNNGSAISFAEASRLSYILPSLSNGLRATVESQFRARSLPLDVKYEIDAIGLIPQCVEAGLGATILPGGCIDFAMEGKLTAWRFEENGCHRTLVITHSADATPTPASSAIIRMIVELTHKLVRDQGWPGAKLIATE